MADILLDLKEYRQFVIDIYFGFQGLFVHHFEAKIVFDTVNEVLDEVEITTIPEEGKTVTTTQVPVYEETNGELIKIGCVTTIDTKNENLIEGFPEDYKYYNSIDEIPEISQKKYEELKKNGNIYEDVGMTLGNPADLSNIQTIVEIYDYIDINNSDY